jgi:YD repeat-containing protein
MMKEQKVKRLLAVTLAFLFASSLAVSQGNPVQYFYDDLGRLVKVIDQSGNVATYSYDAVGNILKVTRSTVTVGSTVAVFSFAPQRGTVGTSVTIQGQGFSSTPSQNTVQFNGTVATVQSATATSLVALVPVGATTGPISVTVNGQTAASDTSFVVIQAPGITSISPTFVLENSVASTLATLSLTGANFTGATFAFPASSGISISSVSVNAAGTTATLSATIPPNLTGAFVLVATGAGGSSSQQPTVANTLHVLDPNADDDHDGLTNAVELALGTNPLNPSTVGDGITDGWKVFYGLNPLDPTVAGQDNDGDGLTNLQEFQQGLSPRDPDRVPPSVAQITPLNNATNVATNGRIVVRFVEPLLTGVPLTAAQSAIQAAAPTLSPATLLAAGQALQSYLQSTCCGNSVVPGVLTLLQGTTPVTGSAQASSDGLSITFTPAQPLTASTTYTVQANGVRDLAGNRMTQQFQSGFTTGTTADATAPALVRTSPLNGDTNVPTNAAITLQFSKPMDPGTLTSQNLQITDQVSGLTTAGIVQVDATGLTAAFIPNPPLGLGRQFTVAPNTSVTDTAGNSLTGPPSFSFVTTFSPENAAPRLVGSSPANGATNIPTNSVIVLEFSEPMNFISALGAIQVSAGGQPVAGSFALSDADRRITFTPAAVLVANTTYTVTLNTALTDMADHSLSNPGSFSFQTGGAADNSTPAVAATSPVSGSVSVPVNTAVQIQFSKPIDPLTVTSSTLQVIPSSGITPIAGAVTVSADATSATFTPSAPLLFETSYTLIASGISDLQANSLPLFTATFTTGVATQTSGPVVVQISPQNGEANIPINSQVVVRLSEAVEPASVRNNAIALTAGGVTVSGSVSVSSDGLRLIFKPTNLLTVSTTYSVSVNGFSDVAGNPVTPFTSSFTTSSSSQLDITPQVLSVSPANGVTGIPVNTQVVLTFNELIDVTSVNASTVQVQAAGLAGSVTGTYTVNGAVVTFTPLSPLPASTLIQVTVSGVTDVSGATAPPLFTSSFTTASGTDTTPLTLLSVTPNNGATNIGLNASVVLTFSKSVNPSTVNNGTLALFANGNQLGKTIAISADNRTVSLTPGTLPASAVVTVVATSGLLDLFGNALADSRSQFTTATALDATHPFVLNQRPGNGASGVPLASSVVLFVNEPLNTSTISNALHITQNGALVQGTVTIRDSGQTIEFVPATAWLGNALIQVFLDSTALDTDGNAVSSYQGSFTTVVSPGNVPPVPIAFSPPGLNDGAVPLNAVAEVQYNEPLDPGSVSADTVQLRVLGASQSPAGAVILDPSDTVIRFVPTIPLGVNAQGSLTTTTAIRGANGVFQTTTFSAPSFLTGAAVDTSSPAVTAVSPPDGSVGVAINAGIHVRFNKIIDRLTTNSGTIQLSTGGQTFAAMSISFANRDQDVVLTPQEPLPDNTRMTITISGVTDLVGHQVVAKTTTFTTGTSVVGAANFSALSTIPLGGATQVPLNTLIAIQTNAPVNPGTVNSLTFQVTDSANGAVAGTYSTSADGRTISFVPGAPLAVEHTYNVAFDGLGITDVAGNLLTCSSACNFSFRTAATPDTTAPAVVGVNPSNQATGVPINAQVLIQFTKPVDQLTLGQVTLSSAGGPVNTIPILSNGQQTLTLIPTVTLSSSTLYTVNVAGVQDLSGNTLPSPVTTSFTTSTKADLLQPVVTTISPLAGATGVPSNAVVQVQFNKAVDPLTVTAATFQVVPKSGNSIPGTVLVSPDAKSATFTPASVLATETKYTVQVTNGIVDVTGQSLQFFSSSFTTGVATQTSGPQVVTVSPPNGSSGVPLNTHVEVVLNEPVEPASVGGSAVSLAAGGVNVAGTIAVSNDRTTLRFVPSSQLAAGTSYNVTVSGFTDAAGNPAVAFTSSFTTGTLASAAGPQVNSVSPPNGQTGVSVSSAVSLTFNEAVDPVSVNTNTIAVSIPGLHAALAGSYTVSGSTVTFTPATVLPGNANIQVQVAGVLDLAGNSGTSFSSSFTTTATVDTTPPTVVSITPNNGATNIGLNAVVVLTFSKSLNPVTVNSQSLGVLGGSGIPLPISVAISADNRTVTLTTGTLPASSVVTVVANGTITDLSGNGLTPFRSQFTTSAGFDTAHAAVVGQRPANGATGVPVSSQIVLFVNEALNAQTVSSGLHVSQNGVLVSGTVQVSDNGQTIQFQPAAPLANNALIQVFVDSTVLDSDGASVAAYQGSFQTIAKPGTNAPVLTGTNPAGLATNVPLNIVPQWSYNEPLNPATVNTNTVLLEGPTGQFVAGTVKLDPSQQLITFVPAAPLAPTSTYDLQTTTGILGTNGVAQASAPLIPFSTGSSADNVNPTVALVVPADASVNVPVNARIHIRFSKPIDPLLVSAATFTIADPNNVAVATAISLLNSSQDVLLTPNTVLPANTTMSITLSGLQDPSGNPVATQTTHFTTGAVPTTLTPVVVNSNPFNGATGVSVNTAITLQTNVPVDPGSVNSTTFQLQDSTTQQAIAGTYSLSASGQTLSFVPAAALVTTRTYNVLFNHLGITDLAGNALTCSFSVCDFSFTTAAANTTGPTVVGVSPPNGFTQVPINAQIVIQFSEPVDLLTLNQITLSGGGSPVTVAQQLTNGNQTLILNPSQALLSLTSYTLTVTGVQDLSGNTISPAFTSTFTTANGADLSLPPAVATVNPFNGAVGFPVNAAIQLQFSKVVDALTVSGATFQLSPKTNGVTGSPVAAAITVAPNGTSATLTPSGALAPSTTYVVEATTGITDLIGQPLAAFSSTFVTAAGTSSLAVVAVSPPNQLSGVAVNAHVDVLLNESANAASVGSNAIVVSANGSTVSGTITVSSDGTRLTFIPAALLAVSTTYSVTVSGFSDLSGNQVVPFSSSFTTSSSGTQDTTPPTVSSVSPPDGAVNVPVTTSVVLTFSKTIDPTSVNGTTIAITDSSGRTVTGNYAVSGAVVTFTTPLSFNAFLPQILVKASNVLDLEGNPNVAFSSSFTTTSTASELFPYPGRKKEGEPTLCASFWESPIMVPVTWSEQDDAELLNVLESSLPGSSSPSFWGKALAEGLECSQVTERRANQQFVVEGATVRTERERPAGDEHGVPVRSGLKETGGELR